MIPVILDLDSVLLGTGLKTKIKLFNVDTSLSKRNEVAQAIFGEVNHNGAMYEFGGLIYEQENILKGIHNEKIHSIFY